MSIYDNKQPVTDLCLTCQLNTENVPKFFLLAEEERGQLHLTAAEHLSHARTERNNYRLPCTNVVEQWQSIARKPHACYMMVMNTIVLIMPNKCTLPLPNNSLVLHTF